MSITVIYLDNENFNNMAKAFKSKKTNSLIGGIAQY